jgi:hypothetical protein
VASAQRGARGDGTGGWLRVMAEGDSQPMDA